VKIKDLRNRFPEYRDMDDEELLEAVYDSSYSDMDYDEFLDEVEDKPEEEPMVTGLNQLNSCLEEIKQLLGNQEKPSDYSQSFADITKSIAELAKHIKNTKAPVVSVEAPIIKVDAPVVNVPDFPNIPQPIVYTPEVKIPAQIKEWEFTPEYDRNGFLKRVKATAL